MRAEPKSLLDSDVGIWLILKSIGSRLQFISFITPNEIDLLFSKLAFPKQSDDPDKKFSFIWIIQIVGVIIRISILLYRQRDIGDTSDSTNFLCSLIEEDLPGVSYHGLPRYVIKSLSDLGKHIGIAFLPYFTH